MTIELRPITPDEFPRFQWAAGIAFGWHAQDDDATAIVPSFEFDRGLAAFDGASIVGTGVVYSFELTLPGCTTVPAGGITWITVTPTHRRRGILTSMMRRHLSNIRERGEPLAMLYTSESSIYGRYGFGISTIHSGYEIDPRQGALARAPEMAGAVRMVDADEARAILPAVYDRARRRIPGGLSQTPGRWDTYFADLEARYEGLKARFYAVYEAASGPIDGYAAYRITPGWENGFPAAQLDLEGVSFIAVTDEARAALWRYCLDVDLVVKVVATHFPADEPLPWMLADPRRFRLTRHVDGLWTRLLDIPTALAARRYSTADRLTFRVEDPFCPENDGVYRLEGSPEGAECSRASADPDLSLQVSDLSACYLGGVRFSTLARASRVVEHTTGALRRGDLMFAVEPLPYCTADF